MLNKVHHVTYVVESISDMAAYMEKSFDIKPISTDEFPDQGFKSILFRIGDTLVDFFEPLRDDTTMARQLKATGPGVMHVAWGVEGIDAAFQSLQNSGSTMRGDAPERRRNPNASSSSPNSAGKPKKSSSVSTAQATSRTAITLRSARC